MRVTFFQPILTNYRVPVFEKMHDMDNVDITVCAQVAGAEFGLCDSDCHNFNFKFIRLRLLKIGPLFFPYFADFLKTLRDSDVVVHFGDFKYTTLLMSALLQKVLGYKLYIHGQGGYKRYGWLHKLVYNLSLLCSDGYICYSVFSQNHLQKITLKFLHRKITVVDNSLYLPVQRVPALGADLLYIGRLRAGCGIDLLLEAAQLANLNVRVIGGGDNGFVEQIRQRFRNLKYYGPLFCEEKQFEVANGCFAGAYGGDAGLSVVHYMSYGLPVVVHNDIYKHMGPEPSYIVDGQNGLTFERGSVQSLASTLKRLKEDSALRAKLSQGAAQTFEHLNNPPMHEKFVKILGLL